MKLSKLLTIEERELLAALVGSPDTVRMLAKLTSQLVADHAARLLTEADHSKLSQLRSAHDGAAKLARELNNMLTDKALKDVD